MTEDFSRDRRQLEEEIADKVKEFTRKYSFIKDIGVETESNVTETKSGNSFTIKAKLIIML